MGKEDGEQEARAAFSGGCTLTEELGVMTMTIQKDWTLPEGPEPDDTYGTRKTYELVQEPLQTKPSLGIRCLLCGLTSWNPNDVHERYCGHCHVFHER